MLIYPNAKINVGLNVLSKREDGYHDLETVFYPVNLQDAIEVHQLKDSAEPYRLHVSGMPIEGEAKDNLVVRAYELLKAKHELPPIDIHLFKHIPTGAGLGGGSSDGAFMIKLLNEKFKLNISKEEAAHYASQLGADCAFFIEDKPVLATGRGECFEPIGLSLKGYYVVIVKPEVSVSTRDAFAHITPRHPEVSIKDIVSMPIETWREALKNDFEQSIFVKHPEIAAIKDEMYELGAVYASMSGSGSAVYGLFKEQVKEVEQKFGGCFCRQRELD